MLYNLESDKYEYEFSSNPTWKKNKEFFDAANEKASIKGFMQDKNTTTLEDSLIYANPTCKELVVESMSNKDELMDLMDHFDEDLKSLVVRLKGSSAFVKEIKKLVSEGNLNICNDEQVEKLKKQIIAHRYLMSVSKGETAQEIAYVLDNNENIKINVPKYIEEAIIWILEN